MEAPFSGKWEKGARQRRADEGVAQRAWHPRGFAAHPHPSCSACHSRKQAKGARPRFAPIRGRGVQPPTTSKST